MIEVIQPGIHTSIQDRGRFGYRNQGIPLSGAMDQYSSHLANQMLGNHADAPLMEFVLQGPKLYFHHECTLAFSGGEWDIELNGSTIDMHQIIRVPSKSSLQIKGVKKGMYGYMAINGGFQTEKVLDSYSFYPKITNQSKLKKGDKIAFKQESQQIENNHNASIVLQEKLFDSEQIKVDKGAEFDFLNRKMQAELFDIKLSPSKDSNRMAYPLNHDKEFSAKEIITAAVQAGTVQLTPSGKMIVLMRDAQTTGGYARILQLPPMSINQLAQKRPGEEFKFSL
jgi:biotin-dependent carboxylase-like uncharacterized protein